jgi:hypothetical protein
MKKFRFALGSLITALIITSCSQDDRSFISVAEAEGIIPGMWRVDYFYDNTHSSSDEFAQYLFDFNSDGTLTANDGFNTYSGVWDVSVTNADPVYDMEIEISISGTESLDHLTSDWLITEMSDVRLRLLDHVDDEEVYFLKL